MLELTDPAKYAEREQRKAEKAAEAVEKGATESAAEESAEEPPVPENLISTDAARPAAPDWNDVPDGTAALYHEGCKQQPGHSSDMMRDFARQFVPTTG